MDLSGEVEVEVKHTDEKLGKPPSKKRPKDSRGIESIGSLVDVPLLQITEHGTNSVLLASSHQNSVIDLGNEIMTSKLAPKTPNKCQKSQDWQPLEVVVGLASEGSVNKDMSQTEAVMDKLDFCTGNGSLKSLAPLTPCKSGKLQDYEPHKKDLSEERLSEANTEKCIYVKVPSRLEQLEHHADVSHDSLSSQPWESGSDKNGGKEEIGLIKSPRKNASKRKKHRPKVIREGKPAKSPKQEKSPLKGDCSKAEKAEVPVTPPIKDNKDNSTLKRVYVRRRKGLISNLKTAVGENMDHCCSKREKSNDCQFMTRDAKLVMRSLNFNLDSEEEDRYQASPGTNKESRAHETFPGSNTDSCGAKFGVELTQGLQVVVNKSPLGIVFDLNCSRNKMLEEYIPLPEHPITSAQHPTSDTISKELKDFGDSGNIMNIIIQIPNDQSQVNSSTHSRAISLEDGIKEIGTKRHYTHIDINQDHSTHGCSIDTSFMQAYEEEKESSKCQVKDALKSYFPEIYKKRRTEKGKKCQYKKAVLHNFRDLTFADGKNTSILDILKDPELLQNYPIIRITKKRSKTATRARKENPKASTDDCNHLLRPAGKQKRSVRFGSKNYGPQTCMEALFADANFQMKTRKRTEKGRLHLVSSMSKIVLGLTAPSGRKFLGRNLKHFQIGSILEHQHRSTNTRGSLYTSFTSPAIHPYTDEIDGVLHKLKCLNLNGDQVEATDKEEYALIPYDLGSMMIPYNHLFNIIKKKRTRARVDLDPETNRLWNLLMGNQRINEDGGVGMDKEKWWEDERRIFRGRIDSFIARMHLIQGDRRFSKWKGSVVDSVVGVFLTQNVSDHLSSSAFMSLAARYPVSFGGNNKKNCSERINISKGEEDESILVLSDDFKQQELMSGTKAFDFGSTGIHESENLKEKAATPEGGSLGSNKRDNALYLKGKVIHADENDQAISPKTLSNKMYTPCTVTGITNLAEAEGRTSIKEIISSQRSAFSLENSLDNLTRMAGEVQSSIESTSEANDLVINSNSDISNLLVENILVRETINNKEPHNYHDEGMLTGNCCAVDEAASVTGKRTTVPDIFNSPIESSTVPDMFNSPRYSSSSVTSDTLMNYAENDFKYVSPASTISHLSNISPSCGLVDAGNSDLCRERGSLPRTKQYVQMVNGSTSKNVSHVSQVQDVDVSTVHQNERNADIDVENFCNVINILTQKQCNREEPECPKSCSKLNERLESSKTDDSNLKDELCAERNQPEMKSSTRVKNVKAETEKNNFDWDSLRKEAFANCAEKERSSEEMDSLDWEAVRCADVDEISNAIRARGMNNVLARRIKHFLNRLVKDHGNIDLEWLRHVPPDKAKAYLLSVRGLGLKSVECVRLLTLHCLAFPVDTNVGRVCVRLGWVPLQPLPESLQLHLLELYPMIEHIQKYLWPRLCTLDQETLYELHYQMITFGKVFCTKSRPNCNACPMRGECKHFASAFASARLLLPGPEEKRLVTSTIPVSSENERSLVFSSGPPFQLENNLHQERSVNDNIDPIIEEPPTPEEEYSRTLESAIEDAFYEDPDDIPVIKLNLEEFTENLQNYILENSGEVEGGDISKALVAINAEAASIPMPKLKNVSRLRTEHRVYELPDSHPLLEMMDQREHNDPCPYLLAIWTPGETAQSTEPPQSCCSCQGTGELCDSNTCFSCNSARETHAQTVRGTLLIPCRTAMRGSFPLNGTYFQVNEVFADHSSSCTPIDIPRKLIWNLPRRTVYFGTSIPTIFRGMTTEEIQLCFWRGFVCIRGFDRSCRAPKPLIARLHIAASKMPNSRKMDGKEGQKNTATAI